MRGLNIFNNSKNRILDSRIIAAKNWLLHSGIQNIGGDRQAIMNYSRQFIKHFVSFVKNICPIN